MTALQTLTRTTVPCRDATWPAQLAARVRAWSLDPALAEGRTDDRLLRVRAAQLVAPRSRQRLARAWLDVLDRAARPAYPLDPRVPVARGRIGAAAELIVALAEALRSPAPVDARGVAMARLLLTSGTSPVYQPTRAGGSGLADAVGATLRCLRAD